MAEATGTYFQENKISLLTNSGLLQNRLIAFRSQVMALNSRLTYERQNLVRLRNKVDQIESDKIQLVKALGLIDRVIGIIAANGIGKIESIVSGGLQLVFKDKQLSFVVERTETKNRGNSYRLLVRHKNVVGSPMDLFGGGVVNVVSFLLRVIMIKRFKLAKFLALDESFNNVSPQYQPNVAVMMTKLCNDHGFLILSITHQPILAAAADDVYQLIVNENDEPELSHLQSHELDELRVSGS